MKLSEAYKKLSFKCQELADEHGEADELAGFLTGHAEAYKRVSEMWEDKEKIDENHK